MKNRAFNLMKLWCDTLLTYQVKTNTPYTNGSLLCPACSVVHGRIADLCFPLCVIWDKTGDEYYLQQADALIDWSEFNIKAPDGLWYNDVATRWYGISAFSAMAIGESLFHFGDRMPKQYKDKWFAIFQRMADGLVALRHRKSFSPGINYYCGFATVLAMAWRLTGNEHYKNEINYWLDIACANFDKDGLLCGEFFFTTAEDGSRMIDMGYNLEESLPLLLRYAQLTGEKEEYFRQRLRDHLYFVLPDGAIDNSWGTRHNKWTYWGSRTADGLVEGLALVLDDEQFRCACERILSLYEQCTHDGLLAMPMAHEANEPTCLHHSFTHAKALATLVLAENDLPVKKTLLPGEEKFGVRKYQNDNLVLVSNGPFRATFTCCQAACLPEDALHQGGSMTLLYVDGYGPLCAATSVAYIPSEPLNQQYLRHGYDGRCMTAQFVIGDYQSSADLNAKLSVDGMTITAKADLWQAKYAFNENVLSIDLTCENGVYNLPIVCKKDASLKISPDLKELTVDGCVQIKSTTPLIVDLNERVFHQVGGLLYLPISVSVKQLEQMTIKILKK